MSDYNYRREAVAALKEIADESQKRVEVKEQAARREYEQTREDVMSIKEHAQFLKEQKERYHHKILNEMMGTALKAIYISAVQKEHSLTESDVHLAERVHRTPAITRDFRSNPELSARRCCSRPGI